MIPELVFESEIDEQHGKMQSEMINRKKLYAITVAVETHFLAQPNYQGVFTVWYRSLAR